MCSLLRAAPRDPRYLAPPLASPPSGLDHAATPRVARSPPSALAARASLRCSFSLRVNGYTRGYMAPAGDEYGHGFLPVG
ncbi:hypothetical protein GUJ93_ZPchr0013g36052 [Zizania palustris]|uniref:Uncharacterized protein n=1 Tax=Zizania palustris TaxID=103762 RepID=A0A8J5WUR4_ZIZPA|nr:hypothetical protein GUJ93_ZPchr0013g36052 [Zizania palustris]